MRKAFENNVVIGRMDLRIEAGEFLAVLGPSGCGKSTLLRMIAGLAQPDSGEIAFERDATGVTTDGFRRAFVFQDAHLLPWRNVLDNAALPLELMGVDREERHRKARGALERVNLQEAHGAFPGAAFGRNAHAGFPLPGRW